MSAADEPGDVARAVLDGAAVNWEDVEAAADTARRPLIQQLRILERVVGVHREDPPLGRDEVWNPTIFTGVAEVTERWGHLAILDRIGSGAFGTVYRAWDTRLDREVALKLLDAPRTPAGPTSSSIIEEGRLLARVRHPNVVTIYGAEQIDDRIGLWMELVRGETLEQALQRGGVLAASDAIAVGRELCAAVSAIHAAGLLHRDIKAQNAMATDDGRVVLMDLGTGRELDDDEGSSDLTGTPLCLAPEVFRGEPATVGSDVYSLGVLLFHLLTRTYPVSGQSLPELRAAHDRGERARVHAVRPDVPTALARIVDRAIDPDPVRRYQSAAALAADLGRLQRPRRAVPMRYVAGMLIAAAIVASVLWRGTPPSQAAQPRVAVLAFSNLGPPGDDELLLGISSEIQHNLTELDGLHLVSFDSSRMFLSQGRDLRQVRGALQADYVVEGTMRLSAKTVYVDVALTSVSNGERLWSKTFEPRGQDAATLPREVAAAVKRVLDLPTEPKPNAYQPNHYAWELYLRALAVHELRNAENAAEAAARFERVVSEDPNYAKAWAGLARAHAAAHRLREGDLPAPVPPRMEEAARKALMLDPTLPDAHAAMGTVYADRREWGLAEASFIRALSMDPTPGPTHTEYVLSVLLPLGRLDEALTQLKAAQSRNPLSLDIRRVMALIQVEMRRFEDAIENARWVLERNPRYLYADLWLGRAYALSGKHSAAAAVFEPVPRYWGYLGYTYAVMGRQDEAREILAAHPDGPGQRMMIYAGLGERDRAYEELAQLVARNPWRAATWIRRPEMEILRGDPRLAALFAQLKVPAGS